MSKIQTKTDLIQVRKNDNKAPFICWKIVSFWKVNSGKVFFDIW
jgi:hypothetical protein